MVVVAFVDCQLGKCISTGRPPEILNGAAGGNRYDTAGNVFYSGWLYDPVNPYKQYLSTIDGNGKIAHFADLPDAFVCSKPSHTTVTLDYKRTTGFSFNLSARQLYIGTSHQVQTVTVDPTSTDACKDAMGKVGTVTEDHTTLTLIRVN